MYHSYQATGIIHKATRYFVFCDISYYFAIYTFRRLCVPGEDVSCVCQGTLHDEGG